MAAYRRPSRNSFESRPSNSGRESDCSDGALALSSTAGVGSVPAWLYALLCAPASGAGAASYADLAVLSCALSSALPATAVAGRLVVLSCALSSALPTTAVAGRHELRDGDGDPAAAKRFPASLSLSALGARTASPEDKSGSKLACGDSRLPRSLCGDSRLPRSLCGESRLPRSLESADSDSSDAVRGLPRSCCSSLRLCGGSTRADRSSSAVRRSISCRIASCSAVKLSVGVAGLRSCPPTVVFMLVVVCTLFSAPTIAMLAGLPGALKKNLGLSLVPRGSLLHL